MRAVLQRATLEIKTEMDAAILESIKKLIGKIVENASY